MKKIYLIGALKNPEIPEIGIKLRELGFEVFDDWFSAGPRADEHWNKHEKQKGRNFKEALYGFHARTVLEFDKAHLDRADVGILIMPAGKSGHVEFGYMAGKGKETYILFEEEPSRYDVMLGFANNIFFSLDELIKEL